MHPWIGISLLTCVRSLGAGGAGFSLLLESGDLILLEDVPPSSILLEA